MKNIFIFILFALPGFLVAQEQNNFLENTTIEVSKIEINTTNSDFGPAFVKNELWYSAFSDTEIEKLSNGKSKDVFYNSYVSAVNADGDLLEGKELVIEEISQGFHSGPVSYCTATKELFVTLSNIDNPDSRNKVYKKSDIRLRIVVLKENDGVWELVEELPFNNPKYSVGHPAISTTGDTVFYSSNNPATSLGQTDLFMSIRINGKWGESINLGENINTSRTEMFPFLFHNNTLIFASDKNGETGLDLYYSVLDDSGFSKPVVLDELNSDADDFGLIIHKNEKLGYFTSNRTGSMGNDDIYKVSFKAIHK